MDNEKQAPIDDLRQAMELLGKLNINTSRKQLNYIGDAFSFIERAIENLQTSHESKSLDEEGILNILQSNTTPASSEDYYSIPY